MGNSLVSSGFCSCLCNTQIDTRKAGTKAGFLHEPNANFTELSCKNGDIEGIYVDLFTKKADGSVDKFTPFSYGALNTRESIVVTLVSLVAGIDANGNIFLFWQIANEIDNASVSIWGCGY